MITESISLKEYRVLQEKSIVSWVFFLFVQFTVLRSGTNDAACALLENHELFLCDKVVYKI